MLKREGGLNMGTRADFYIAEGEHLNWVASQTHDGYLVDEAKYPNTKAVKEASSVEEFMEALGELAKDINKVWIWSDEGWPWPWENSHKTDYVYIFRKDKVEKYSYEERAALVLPDMSHLRNVKGAGFMFLGSM